MEGAVKHDTGKVRFDLIPARALHVVAQAFTFGASKYGDWNWTAGRGLESSRLYRAAFGHMFKWWLGEDLDPESGLPHLSHAICNLMMLLEAPEQNDNRFYKEKK